MGIENIPRAYQEQPKDISGEDNLQQEASPYALEIKSVVGNRNISVVNSEPFESGEGRFVYAFTEPSNPAEKTGFVKLGRKDQVFEAPDPVSVYMQREVWALQVAKILEIPTPNVIHAYTETPDGYGLIHIEALRDGTALPSSELIAGAPAEYGEWIANTLSKHCAKELPPGIDSKGFRRTDERNESLQMFLQTWDRDVQLVAPSLSAEQLEDVTSIIEGTKSDVLPLLRAAEGDQKEYFVHNDLTPANTFFNDKEKTVMLLDFERAGTTHNKLLAYITDVGTFYARAWPNPEMQRVFLQTMLGKATPETINDEYIKLKTAVVFTSTFLAKWAVSPSHRERSMYTALLGNLEKNLEFLAGVYEQQKTKNSESTTGPSTVP